MYKKVILIDLDGVLNTYDGTFDENVIPPIRKGAVDFLKKLSQKYKIKIFTTRKLMLASMWIIENRLEKYIENITNIKEPCYLIIDDRCINFNGNYADIEKQINNFKVWYK